MIYWDDSLVADAGGRHQHLRRLGADLGPPDAAWSSARKCPFPFVKLVLERLPDRGRADGSRPRGRQVAMIELTRRHQGFGAKRAVDRLDLHVRAGELFAFLGPNGAGKTTTIKMVCGLLAPTSGTVRVGGYPGGEPARPASSSPTSPTSPISTRSSPAASSSGSSSRCTASTAAAPRRRIDELIDTFEMGDYIDELCEGYSHGMKQRVVFASALVHDPKVLIVDEPLVGLDPRSARIVKDLFVSQARSGVAVLMSTHLLSIAEELADTIGIVDHGRMLARGTLAEIRERVQIARAARRPLPQADRRRPAALVNGGRCWSDGRGTTLTRMSVPDCRPSADRRGPRLSDARPGRLGLPRPPLAAGPRTVSGRCSRARGSGSR